MFRFVRGRVRLLFFPGFIIFYAEKSNRLWGGILLEIIIITFTTCFFVFEGRSRKASKVSDNSCKACFFVVAGAKVNRRPPQRGET